MDRPHPGRRCRWPAHAASDRRALGRQSFPPRWDDRVTVTVAEPLGVTEPDDPDPHGRSDHRHAQPDADRDGHGGTDDASSDSDAIDAATHDNAVHTAADQHPGADQNALGPAKLRDDRCELAHRIARHRDVADAQALAPLEEQLA